MSPARIHTRIIQHPFAQLVQGGRLDSYHENDHELILGIQGLKVISSDLLERGGKLYECVNARYTPFELTFSNISKLKRDEFFLSLEDYVEDDPSRVIAYMLSWRQPKMQDIFHMLGLRGPADADLSFFAQYVTYQNQETITKSVSFERDWSPAPPLPERLVPRTKYLYRSFGGDPITINFNGQTHQRRLFIGSLENQLAYRPHVDAILNLGEESSRWVDGKNLHPADRAVHKGEGAHGMNVDEIHEEANWIIERLKDDQRVLVHCVAGMNRSATICCAVLILFEGLSTDEALTRVREHHPWARPDSYHWLALRWLEKSR